MTVNSTKRLPFATQLTNLFEKKCFTSVTFFKNLRLLFMSVYFRGTILYEDICAAYEGDDAALVADLGRDKPVPNAMFCVIRRAKPAAMNRGRRYGLSEEDVDTTLLKALMDLIGNIKRGQNEGNGDS
jgi:hypothetical protein